MEPENKTRVLTVFNLGEMTICNVNYSTEL